MATGLAPPGLVPGHGPGLCPRAGSGLKSRGSRPAMTTTSRVNTGTSLSHSPRRAARTLSSIRTRRTISIKLTAENDAAIAMAPKASGNTAISPITSR